MTKLTFGQKLMILRRNKNLSQKKLAELTGIGVANIARYETESTSPNIQNLIALSNFFKVSTDYLLKENSISFNINDPELIEMINKINDFPEQEKNRIKNLINSYIKG